MMAVQADKHTSSPKIPQDAGVTIRTDESLHLQAPVKVTTSAKPFRTVLVPS